MLHFDLETRGVLELKKCGSHSYSMHPHTDVWCLCYYDSDTDTFGTWTPNDPVPEVFQEPMETFCAWNAQFERNIHQNILVPRYGFEPIDVYQWEDTAAWARQLGLPSSLAKSAIALGFPVDDQKDREGTQLMLRMARPRHFTDRGIPVWWEDEERLARLIEYCEQDVRVEVNIRKQLRETCRKIPNLSEA
jgi:DNA polymerase